MDFPFFTLLTFLAGLAGLVFSSHYFVGGSASLASHLGMRPGLIGLTIVAFGTSAPEILVSASAALDGAPDLGIGNALGSNIANIGLVLGVTALVARLPVHRWLFRLEVPLLVAATAMAATFLSDYQLTFIEGALLLICALLFPVVLVLDARRQPTNSNGMNDAMEVMAEASTGEDIPNISLAKAWLWLACGLLALLVSSEILVGAATRIAEFYRVSPLVIGVTIVAVGTSLPELAASITSALKGHQEMAIGNIVGSNILNIFAVMSLPGILMPITMEPEVFNRDVLAMVVLTVVLIAIVFAKTHALTQPGIPHQQTRQAHPAEISWPSGLLLLSIYIAYYLLLFLTGSAAN